MFLEPNHSHFILVDDGSESQFGKEIEFRAHLENELRKGESLKYYRQKRSSSMLMNRRLTPQNSQLNELNSAEKTTEKVPVWYFIFWWIYRIFYWIIMFFKMVLIVVQGGAGTFRTVEESLKQNVPILVLAVMFWKVNYNLNVIVKCYFMCLNFRIAKVVQIWLPMLIFRREKSKN